MMCLKHYESMYIVQCTGSKMIIICLFYRMGPVIQLKSAVIDKGAMWELVQRVTACVAHVKCILQIIARIQVVKKK